MSVSCIDVFWSKLIVLHFLISAAPSLLQALFNLHQNTL